MDKAEPDRTPGALGSWSTFHTESEASGPPVLDKVRQGPTPGRKTKDSPTFFSSLCVCSGGSTHLVYGRDTHVTRKHGSPTRTRDLEPSGSPVLSMGQTEVFLFG